MNHHVMTVALVVLTTLTVALRADQGADVSASQSLTIQPNGPRTGESGTKYFNVEGKENDKYASFGVLIFDVPKDVQGRKVKGMTLVLAQSVPRFAKNGAIKFFLAPEFDPKAELKFVLNSSDGVGGQIKVLRPLGSGSFKKVENGKADAFRLMLDDAAREQIARGGKLCLVVVPADGAVAATYFGADEQSKEKSPRLTLELP